jgi:hypothetical protein
LSCCFNTNIHLRKEEEEEEEEEEERIACLEMIN